jgi:hypothetical protein
VGQGLRNQLTYSRQIPTASALGCRTRSLNSSSGYGDRSVWIRSVSMIFATSARPVCMRRSASTDRERAFGSRERLDDLFDCVVLNRPFVQVTPDILPGPTDLIAKSVAKSRDGSTVD